MLTEEEIRFLEYWGHNRSNKKRRMWQLAAGLPLAAVLAVGIVANYFSGWYTRADMQIRLNASGVLVVLTGILLIVVFVVVFSSKHKWDLNEQRYKELMAKRKKQ